MKEEPTNKPSITVGNVTSTGGNVIITSGNITQSITQYNRNATLADFNKILAEISSVINLTGLNPEIAGEAKTIMQSVEAQSKKEKPNLALITGKLKSLTELIGAAAGAETALQQISPLIQKAVQLAQQLFH